MKRMLGSLATLFLISISIAVSAAAAQESTEQSVFSSWTLEEKERFLEEAEIVEMKGLKIGITGSQRALLSDGKVSHDAHIQDVDIFKAKFENESWKENHFRDSYRYNIAAYRLDKMLGLNMVPVTVFRKVKGRRAAVAWWVDDVEMSGVEILEKKAKAPDERLWTEQRLQGWVFQNLVYNIDPNYGNFLVDKDWNLWMIDYTRAFRKRKAILDDRNLKKIGRVLYQRLQDLELKEVREELGPFLDKIELKALMARRKLLVKYFEDLIEEKGEAAVVIGRPGF